MTQQTTPLPRPWFKFNRAEILFLAKILGAGAGLLLLSWLFYELARHGSIERFTAIFWIGFLGGLGFAIGFCAAIKARRDFK